MLDGIQRCPGREATRLEVVIVGDDETALSGVRVELRDGSRVQKDRSDVHGRCRFDGIERGRSVAFTLAGVDSEAWGVRASCRLRAELAVSTTADATWTEAGSDDPSALPSTHEVRPGECLHVLAQRYGFTADSLWNHPPNAAVWTEFHSRAVISPGSYVEIPARRMRWEAATGGWLYLVHRIGAVVRLRIRLLDPAGRPVARRQYVLALVRADRDDLPHRVGETDQDGFVCVRVPADVCWGRIIVLSRDGRAMCSAALSIGTLPPADEPDGISARLANLGHATSVDPEVARSPFQRAHAGDGQAGGGPTSRGLLELHLS
jgi:hypothetical protein